MADVRERPYMQFNFLVNLGDNVTDTPDAGFQEISNIGMEVAVAEYRTGNYGFNNVRKVTGLYKATDVTLKRGIIGSLALYTWLDAIRNGSQGPDAIRQVTIHLLSEDRQTVVLTWKLSDARMINYISGPFSAKGADVAMEEMKLAYERVQVVQGRG
jgi:phage tail-like protein